MRKDSAETLALSCHIAFFNSEIQRYLFNAGEGDKPSQLTLILFDKTNRVCDLCFEVGKVCFTCNRVKSRFIRDRA